MNLNNKKVQQNEPEQSQTYKVKDRVIYVKPVFKHTGRTYLQALGQMVQKDFEQKNAL